MRAAHLCHVLLVVGVQPAHDVGGAAAAHRPVLLDEGAPEGDGPHRAAVDGGRGAGGRPSQANPMMSA